MLKIVRFKNRIDELDFLKGIAVLFMLANHIFYDFGFVFRSSFYGTSLYDFCTFSMYFHSSAAMRAMTYVVCSSVFIGVSGILSTVSKHTLRQGLILAAVSLAVTAASMIVSGVIGEDISIKFGILHLMAVCMLLSPLLKKIPTVALPFTALTCLVAGILFRLITIDDARLGFLSVFNFNCIGFFSSDYYPVLPHISFYIAGIFIGKLFYENDRQTHLTFTSEKVFLPLRFLGAYTFEIYVIHQPILYGAIYLMTLFAG